MAAAASSALARNGVRAGAAARVAPSQRLPSARARCPGGPVPDDGTAAALLERLGRAAASPDGAGLPDVAGWHATALAERDRFDAEVRALAQRARLRLDPDAPPATTPPTPTGQLGLTPREAEVLALVAAGRSNRQIAAALFISPKTASVHVSNILAKLGVATRVEAAAVATRVEAAAVAHRLGLD
jgi:DNA-binding NarL/FixJ family response regulator